MPDSASPTRATWSQRLFASLMSRSQPTEYDRHKQTLLRDLRGDVLEIGPGTGPNLAFYDKSIRWTGIEPNPAMWPYLRQEAVRLGLTVDLREGRAEQLGVPDESCDAVVSTLVLCSVRSPQWVLQEIRRVLRPGGRFVFIEHVAAPAGTGLRRFQQVIRPLWKPLTEGCHPDRETWVTIEQAGFRTVQLEHFRISAPIVGPHIAGYAVK